MGRVVAASPIAAPVTPSSGSVGQPSPSAKSTIAASVDNLASVIASLRQDPNTAQFLEPSKTPADHVGAAVREKRVPDTLVAAQTASTTLASAVREEVVLQKEALLAEVDAVAALEKEVATVDSGVQSLASASGALADALAGPYEPMKNAVTTLHNVQAAGALLRAVERFGACTKKLADASLFPTFSPSVKTPPETLHAAADAVRELEDLLGAGAGAPLDKVDVVAKHVSAVRKSAAELRKRAGAMLRLSIATRDQQMLMASVSAFHALGVLPDRVNAEVARLLSETQAALQRGFEPPRTVTSGASGLSFPSAFRSRGESSGSSGPKEGNDLHHSDSVGHAILGSSRRSQTENGNNGGAGGESVAGNGLADSSGHTETAGSSKSEPSWEVWSRMAGVVDTVRDACLKAIVLQQVLGKRYDEVEHVSLLHEPIASGFIDAIAKALGEQISLLARTHRQRASAGQIFRALVADYPKLRSMLITLSTRVHALARTLPHPITSFELSGTAALVPPFSQLPTVPDRAFIENAFLTCSTDVETHYLTASLDRLTSAVSTAFEAGRPAPGEAEALAVVRLCSAELTASRSDRSMFATSVANVATALRIYCSHAEDFVASQSSADAAPSATSGAGAESRVQRGGPVREWSLARLHNGLVTLATASKRVLGSDEDGAGVLPPLISKEIANISKLAETLLASPFAMCTARVARAIENIHTEDLTCDPGSDDGCSIYAVNVATQLSMFASGVVLSLTRSRSLGRFTVALAHKVLDLFVVHATLAFPLNEVARVRLATDMARVEDAVESMCPVRMLGESYLGIRALRSLVFMSDDELCVQPPAEETLLALASLPPSTVAHHLFSRCTDSAFVHPHRHQNKTPGEYATWLDAQSEDDAWSAVEESASLYEKSLSDSTVVRCPQYRALKALLPKLRERWGSEQRANNW